MIDGNLHVMLSDPIGPPIRERNGKQMSIRVLRVCKHEPTAEQKASFEREMALFAYLVDEHERKLKRRKRKTE